MTKRGAIGCGAVAVGLLIVLIAVGAVRRLREHLREPAPQDPIAAAAEAVGSGAPGAQERSAAPGASQGYLYGRVTTTDGVVHEGRLRFGGGREEAFWGDAFNGFKPDNRWADELAPDQRPMTRGAVSFLGLEIVQHKKPLPLGRVFMARFGDLARIETEGSEVRVTLKSGTVYELDRFEAGDIDDDLRIWDEKGVVDLETHEIAAIDFLPHPATSSAPARLRGTVTTTHGEFAGFVEWDRDNGLVTDMLPRSGGGGRKALRFAEIRSITRRSPHGLDVTLVDGRAVQLSGHGGSGDANRGVYVDDRRYGRVLVPWGAFERLELSDTDDSGPGYGDFAPGSALRGAVTTRDGRRLAGRLVYDLDESETTETLDSDAGGVDYLLPFGLVESIALPAADAGDDALVALTLRTGEQLELAKHGDLGAENLGLLVFVEGAAAPQYLGWSEVARIDFDAVPPLQPPAQSAR